MKLANIYESVLLENQYDYLVKKYPDVDPALVQQAIDVDRRNAEKLIYGYSKGVIDTINADSVAAVSDLDPFAKAVTKSESELAYDREIKAAKQINPKYWQWIIRVRRNNPDANIDQGIFHYLEGEGFKTEDILDKTLEEVAAASQAWHNEQFADQQANGTYSLTPENDAVMKIGSFAWVPVYTEDALIEGAKMQNCIGRYCKPSEDTKIFSLRNSYNNPHVSLSVKKERDYWILSEIKGKNNRRPISKYVPYVLQFCEMLFKRNIDPSTSGDFWHLDSPDLINYVKYVRGSILQLPRSILDIVPDETLNEMLTKNGTGNMSVSDEIIPRLTADTVIALTKMTESASARNILKKAIKYGVLNEQQTASLLEEHGVSRSVRMLVMARFQPEQFLQSLKQIDLDDMALAGVNYYDAIEAYPTTDEYFGQLFRRFLYSPESDRYFLELLNATMQKSPTNVLYEIYNEGAQPNNAVYYIENRFIKIINEILSRAMASNSIEEIKNAVRTIKPNFRWEYNTIKPIDIVLAVEYDDLPELYSAAANQPALTAAISDFVRNVNQAESKRKVGALAGTTEDVLQATEFILGTDDIAALNDLRRTTKSRGIKVMVDRKIARLNRMRANAGL